MSRNSAMFTVVMCLLVVCLEQLYITNKKSHPFWRAMGHFVGFSVLAALMDLWR